MSTTLFTQIKLNENKSAVLVNSTILKLVEAIEKKKKSGQTDKDLEEFKVLRELCGSDSPLVSVTACHWLVHLVKSCPTKTGLTNTMSALVASLFSVKSVTGVISALTELLILDLRCQLAETSAYCCPFNPRSPQHPLVAVLRRRPEAWPDVLNQVATVCTHSDNEVQNHSLELVKPVLMFVLMETNELKESARLQAFRVIVNYFPDKDFLVEALASCLLWPHSRVLEVVQLVTVLGQSALVSKNGLLVSLCCLALAALVPRLLSAALCPRPTLQVLSQLAATATNTHSTLLAILAESIPVCPAVYLEQLLTFFVDLLGRGQCSVDCVWMCVVALMPWLASNPSHLHKALHTATLIVSHAARATASACTTATLLNNPAVLKVVSADSRLSQAIHIARLSEVLRGDAAATVGWLKSLKLIELDQVHQFVSALLVSRREAEVKLAALQALVASRAPMASSHNLTLMLYHLARERQPDIQLALLRALPSTAVEKNNVMGVVSTLEALRRSGHESLSLLAVDLYCQLWLHQERCYPQLMDVLNHDYSKQEDAWLEHMLQASICKTICDTKPEMHGKEVVAKVSDLLNKCAGLKDGPAAALALDALIPLCQHDVVDVFTIWRSIAPRFSRDKRPPVLRSLCRLVSVGAVQKSTTADVEDTLHQILKWLFNLVATSKHAVVVEDALKALAKFRLDQMKLKMLPEVFRKGLKLPPEMVKTPADAARKPEDVLEYIPGECWVQLIQHVSSEAASVAVASWIKMEVASFRGPLYQVDRQEPSSYGHLPHSSVVRGLVTALMHLSKSSAPEDMKTAGLCLVALYQPTPKPLPSLSWAFLNDFTDPALTRDVVRLATKQSQISPSSRKITEKFLSSTDNDKNKIEFLYSILGDLCRGIPPNTLRPFIERTLQSALNQKDNQLFAMMLGHIKTTLKEEKIHEANRTLLHQQVKLLWDLIEPQNEVLSEYYACVSELPVSVIESMTSTSLMWEVTSAQLQKAFRLRAFMALIPDAPQSLNWINEVIEVASSNISEQALALELVRQVMSQLYRHESAWPWLLELMGQTHLTSLNNKGAVEFLVTVFVLCVDLMSGYSVLSSAGQDTRALRFPQAIASLTAQNGNVEEMAEWLNHMKSIEYFPAQFTSQFQLAARNVSRILG